MKKLIEEINKLTVENYDKQIRNVLNCFEELWHCLQGDAVEDENTSIADIELANYNYYIKINGDDFQIDIEYINYYEIEEKQLIIDNLKLQIPKIEKELIEKKEEIENYLKN